MREFASSVTKVLVVEELDSFLEEHIRSLGIDAVREDGYHNLPWEPASAHLWKYRKRELMRKLSASDNVQRKALEANMRAFSTGRDTCCQDGKREK